MNDFEHIPSYVYIYKLHVCIYYKTYTKIEVKEEKINFFLYPTSEAIALSNVEQRNNFKLVELLSCLCFRLTTQAEI